MTIETEKPANPQRRHLRRGERAKVSIMQIFRSSFEDKDARRASERSEMFDSKISIRSRQRREGVSEKQLRDHLQADLAALLNTIRLDAVVDLEDAPLVARSILNYGFRDLSSISASELKSPQIVQSLRQSLIDHEPRLVPNSIEVKVVNPDSSTNQRMSIAVSAELMADPVDIPMSFEAEVDLGAGKLKMSRLRIQM